METVLIFLGKLIASSALLYAFYWLVMRNKASYTMARLYLLLLPFVSIMMSGLTLKVLPSSITTANQAVIPTPADEVTEAYWIRKDGKNFKKVRVSQEELDEINKWHHQEQEEGSSAFPSFWQEVVGLTLVLTLWAVVALVLLVIALYHIIYLYALGRKMKKMATIEGYTLVYSPKVPAPCSFGRTIFMPTGITDWNEVGLCLLCEHGLSRTDCQGGVFR